MSRSKKVKVVRYDGERLLVSIGPHKVKPGETVTDQGSGCTADITASPGTVADLIRRQDFSPAEKPEKEVNDG